MPECPFDDSRRLTGINACFDRCGAALEAIGTGIDDDVLRHWQAGVERMAARLHWPAPRIVTRRHASGVSLAFSAPPDQLYSATDLNEWALLGALAEDARSASPLHAPGHPAAWDEALAIVTLQASARAEHVPGLTPLLDAAQAQQRNALLDDEFITLGSGVLGRSWPMALRPQAQDVDWPALGDIPLALVTGSNGKTTTVRLLAAMLREHGWRTAHSCTDGVFLDGALVEAGDYSGPGGARAALRQPGAEAAVLETARGGILRRGLALQFAPVAVVTNVSDDHFGEYGIHDLDALAEVKLVVAHALGDHGVLVANADDAVLARHARAQGRRMAWFALDDASVDLQAARTQGASTCAMRDARLRLWHDGVAHDLGAVASMPLSVNGSARYNIANLAAAALAACALGVEVAAIRRVLSRFGRLHSDNPGRLQQWSRDGVRVLLDYAHNPDGLHALRGVVEPLRGKGRLGMVLGHAGNREDDNLRDVAAAAADFRPDRVLLKEVVGYERGRAPGEVPAILRAALAELGYGANRVIDCLDEYEAARQLLAWARPGDVLVLPILTTSARTRVGALLDAWQAGVMDPAA